MAHTALGYVRLLNDWDPSGAESAFKRAVQLSPNDPRTLQGYLINLSTQERTEEALRISQRLVMSSPNDFHQRAERIRYLYASRLDERALKEAEGVRVLEPGFRTSDEAAGLHRLGRFEESHHSRIAALRRCGTACDRARVAAERGWKEGGYEGSYVRWQSSSSRRTNGEHTGFMHNSVSSTRRLWTWTSGRSAGAVVSRHESPPESPARMADVGRLMAFRGRAPEALERLDRAMAASPEDPRSPSWLESMAWAYFAVTDYTRAASWAERVLEHDLSRHAAAFAHLLRAASHAHLDRADVAKEALQEAQESWPTTLQVDRDLRPCFLGGDQDLGERYLAGLRKAGLED